MENKGVKYVLLAVVVLFGTAAVVGWILQLLWNNFVPELFGLPEATWKHMFLMFLFFKFLQTIPKVNVKK